MNKIIQIENQNKTTKLFPKTLVKAVSNDEGNNLEILLNEKLNKSEAFSGDYEDLDNKPVIPSITGLATEQWVQNQKYLTTHQDISNKVDKVSGKGLSTNDFSNTLKTDLETLINYYNNLPDYALNSEIDTLNQQKEDKVSVCTTATHSTLMSYDSSTKTGTIENLLDTKNAIYYFLETEEVEKLIIKSSAQSELCPAISQIIFKTGSNGISYQIPSYIKWYEGITIVKNDSRIELTVQNNYIR